MIQRSPRSLVIAASLLGLVAASSYLLAQSTFSPFCFGTTNACPCGNAPPSPDTGCMNSFAQGGKLDGLGNAQVTNDTVRLNASGLPVTATIIFFQGDVPSNGGSGIPFGDGLKCVEGPMTWRLGVRQAVAGHVSLGNGIPGDPVLSVRGGIPATGGTIHYQGWYRNAAAFCTPDGFNTTNAISVTWIP